MARARDTRGRDCRRLRRPVAALVCAGVALALLASRPPTASARARCIAPPGHRVDLTTPTFSHPTAINNPLFPVSTIAQAVHLGHEADERLRTETTLLDRTRTFHWNGQTMETRVSQFVAYLDGRIAEVAYDYFAQADDGAVWYFGEHVDNYEDGRIVDHDGTWLAGRDGPPGMIMPAHPRVGDVYRPENIPGLVFEEVTVKAVDLTVRGPSGPVRGAILVQECLMDRTLEEKVFAPGYGEFNARTADELVTVAVAVPIDGVAGPVPEALTRVSSGAEEIFRWAPAEDWRRLRTTLDRVDAAWERYRSPDVPPLLEQQMTDALETLQEAIAAHDPADVRQAAVDLGHASLDLQLRYRSPDGVDRDRIVVWSHQVLVDSAARDRDEVAGDVAVITTIRDRIDA